MRSTRGSWRQPGPHSRPAVTEARRLCARHPEVVSCTATTKVFPQVALERHVIAAIAVQRLVAGHRSRSSTPQPARRLACVLHLLYFLVSTLTGRLGSQAVWAAQTAHTRDNGLLSMPCTARSLAHAVYGPASVFTGRPVCLRDCVRADSDATWGRSVMLHWPGLAS